MSFIAANDTSCPKTATLEPLLQAAAGRHNHLCPRIVLGVRIGLYGLQQLGLIDDNYQPMFVNKRKRLFTFVEIDGCGADGICTATDCWVVRRTLNVVDYGKMAATLVDRKTGNAVRVAPTPEARSLAAHYAPHERSRWHTYLKAYQLIPDHLLLKPQLVQLTGSLDKIISRAGIRTACVECGEEIVNEREVYVNDQPHCRACADGGYYFV